MRKYYTFLLFFLTIPLFSQSINTEFGKNRVQHHDDFRNWSRYETENFVTYWYGKSRNIAQPIIQLAEFDHDEIQRLLEHTISDKIEIIVYIDISDLKQSNIGLEDAFSNRNGYTKIQGNKMLVHFDGNHQHLREEIRRGIASVYMNSILFGTTFQEIVQNALLLNLPDWFKEGLIAYAGSNWNYEIDDELRDLLSYKEKFSDFEKLALDHPRAAGHSLWHFIAESYGATTIANIIYLTRINRNLENSFLFILGQDYETIKKEWFQFYDNMYKLETDRFQSTESLIEEELKNKKGVPVSFLKLNPDGSQLAYNTNDKGKSKIFIKDLATGEQKMIFKKGYKNIFQATDHNYPLLSWHPRKLEVTIIYEHRDIVYFRIVNLITGEFEEESIPEDYQRIYSFDYIDNENYVMSASKDGYSDLYVFKSKTRGSIRLTNDFYDDLDASVINYKGEKSILFTSNRPSEDISPQKLDTILPIENFDIFILQGLEKRGDRKCIQLTATDKISERQVKMGPEGELYYLSEKSGMLNAYRYNLKSGDKKAVTNFERNIILYDVVPESNYLYSSYYHHGNYKTFYDILDQDKITKPPSTVNYIKRNKKKDDVQIPLQIEEKEEMEITSDNMFQSDFEDPPNIIPLDEYLEKEEVSSVFDKYFNNYFSDNVQDGKRVIKYSPMRATASRIKFRLADFSTRLDNSVLFEGLESYAGSDRDLTNIPVGILFKGVVKDIFEDYQLQVGLRLPTTFNGYEFFFVFDDNKHHLDKRFAFYRRAETNIVDATTFPIKREKRHSFLGLYRIKYPFDVYSSLRLTGSLRFDKYFRLVTDAASLNLPQVNEKRLSLRAEYVFDNSFDVSINIKNGTRAKFYSEVINLFNLEFGAESNVDLSKGFTTVIGFDARHYIPIFKDAVLAIRGTGATSFGNNRIVYYLGGVESAINSTFDQSIPVPQSDDFSFKVLAPHLRGFDHNIRNGNSYLLANTELRIPIFRLLGMRKRGLAFFKNFQIAGFVDAGFAWYGLGPNDDENLLNNINIQNPPDNPVISINARYFRDPLVMGYGLGARTTLLGYFLKFDYAWGVETRTVLDPKWYLSIGMDF